MANTTYGGNPYGSNPSGNNPYGTNPYGTNLDYGTSDPRKIASQQRRQDASQYAQGTAQQQGIADYLSPIESQLAQGQGGYNADELSQIRMTPQQQQNIVTGAGISAGTNTAASVDAANRAAAAAGGNPSALAAYRARAARQIGQQAGDAMTQARIGASNAAAQRASEIGQARMGQQNQGLGYYGGLQQMYNQNAQNAAQRQESASGLGLQASQTPSTFDKVMGGVSGALSFLDEGDVSSGSTPAVVGENGPEKVVDLSAEHMDLGGYGTSGIPSLASATHSADYNAMVNDPASGVRPVPALAGTTTNNPDGSVTFNSGDPSSQSQGFWKRFGTNLKNNLMGGQSGAQAQPRTSPFSPGGDWSRTLQSGQQPMGNAQTVGQGIGKLASLFLEDGGIATTPGAGFQSKETMRKPHGALSTHGFFPSGESEISAKPAQGANGVFTSPTRVNLKRNEAVVPLSYRAGAKVRPSMAALPAARTRHPYGAQHGY